MEVFVPAPGQGALGVTVRGSNEKAVALAALVHDPATARAVAAERAFLLHLGGGCKTPIACHAVTSEQRITVHGFVASPDGRTVLRRTLEGGDEAGEDLGRILAEEMIAEGAQALLNGA